MIRQKGINYQKIDGRLLEYNLLKFPKTGVLGILRLRLRDAEKLSVLSLRGGEENKNYSNF